MRGKRVFVTVGTTKFDELIDEVSNPDTIDLFHSLGFTSILFQVGNSNYEKRNHSKVHLNYEPFFNDFNKEICKSDLIIGHAGAGTCIEVLKQNKPLIVVVNENLMDNHQFELAKRLAKEGHLHFCTVQNLKATLKNLNLQKFKQFPPADSTLFPNYLDECMGFK